MRALLLQRRAGAIPANRPGLNNRRRLFTRKGLAFQNDGVKPGLGTNNRASGAGRTTCADCRACAKPREAVIGFPAHGSQQKKAEAATWPFLFRETA